MKIFAQIIHGIKQAKTNIYEINSEISTKRFINKDRFKKCCYICKYSCSSKKKRKKKPKQTCRQLWYTEIPKVFF